MSNPGKLEVAEKLKVETEKLAVFVGGAKRRLLFGFLDFSLCDGLAHFAGVLTAESHISGFGEGAITRVILKHIGPRKDL